MSDSPEVLDAVSTEVAKAEPVEQSIVHRTETADEAKWRLFKRIALSVSNTEFVPRGYRGKPDAIMACLAYGRELGLGEMQSLQSINVIDGKPTLAPEAMRSLVRRAGHKIETVAYTDEVVTLQGTRNDGSAEVVSFSMQDARRAGLVRNGSAWQKYPRAMLSARCTSELCRLLFSDVIMGASYTPEEMGEVGEPDGPEPMPERREPPLQIVTSGSRGAGHVVRQAKGWNWHTVGGEAVCNECTHPCDDHDSIRRGCTHCACKITEWTPLEESAGPASPVSLPGEAEPAGAPEAVASAPVNDDDQTAYAHAEGPALAPTSPPAGVLPVAGGEADAAPGGRPDPTRVAPGPASTRSPLTIEERQRRAIFATCKELAIGDDARHALIALVTGKRTSSAGDLYREEGAKVLAVLGKIKTDDCRMEEREGEWVLVAYSEIGVKFLEATATAMVPRADRSGSLPRATEPVTDEERDRVI